MFILSHTFLKSLSLSLSPYLALSMSCLMPLLISLLIPISFSLSLPLTLYSSLPPFLSLMHMRARMRTHGNGPNTQGFPQRHTCVHTAWGTHMTCNVYSICVTLFLGLYPTCAPSLNNSGCTWTCKPMGKGGS